MKKIFFVLFVSFVFHSCTKESTSLSGGTGTGGSTARFAIAGNYLYTVDNTSLKAFDLSGTAPILKSTTDVGVNIETIFPYQGKLFIGSSSAMHIFSITNPEKPARLAQANYTIQMNCDPVVVKDDVAYATLNATGPCGRGLSALVVYDIKDIGQPELKTTLPVTAPYGLGITNGALYVCDGQYGLRVYNTSNPLSPQEITVITGHNFYDVIPYGNILICQVADGLAFYDISERLNPQTLSKLAN